MASSVETSSKRPSDQEIVGMFNTMKQDLQSMATKIGELEMDREEHILVIGTLKPLSSDRKCFRLVGGILMERTIKEVLPALETNVEGIKQVITQIATQYKKRETEMQDLQRKYDIKVVSRG